jgi:thioredoxin reductase (NADPH)
MYDIIIIGAGPAGISMAAEAKKSGINSDKILLIEKSHEHSWTIKKFYPDAKKVTANFKGQPAVCQGVMCMSDTSKDEAISYLDMAIGKYNLQVHYKESVNKLIKNEDGSFTIETNKEKYQTTICAIAIGMMGKPNKPDYKMPPSLIKNHIHYDITSTEIKDQKVLVVGGGDSASEYAQFLSLAGNDVTLSYRQESFMRMNDINLESIKALEEQKKLKVYLKCNVIGVEESKDSKPLVNFSEDTFASEEFDHVVYALGGSTPTNFLKLLGIEFDGNTPIITESFETSIPGLFLIGDLSAGRKGGSLISAFNSANSAMARVCNDYLSCTLDKA